MNGRVSERTDKAAAVMGLLCALAFAPFMAIAQQGKPKVPPQLPPQASDQAQQKVAEHTAPSVSLSAPGEGALYHAPAVVVLEATAAASSGGRSITQVEFFAGETSIGIATAAPYALSWSGATAGSYSLTARATDNLGVTTTSTPVAVIVNAPPTVSLSSPANDATFNAPASIPVSVDAADSDGSITRVEFYNGASLIATLTEAPYTINWTQVPVGSYSITAKVSDNLGAMVTSALVSVTVKQQTGQLYFIHSDHLNTPRLITNQTGQAVWRWENTEPFGDSVPNDNPSGLGNFTCNLRFPGQYFDKETNVHYNYKRDYASVLGRYIQSDPIGLAGGINTYAYVGGNPISRVDPNGFFWFQQPWQAADPIVGRERTFVPPGGPISSFIEKYMPAGRTMAEIHDPLVDVLTRAGVPDDLANIPTMPFAYLAAYQLEWLRTFGLIKQPAPVCRP